MIMVQVQSLCFEIIIGHFKSIFVIFWTLCGPGASLSQLDQLLLHRLFYIKRGCILYEGGIIQGN